MSESPSCTVCVRGPDAGKFLHGLVTNDILGLAPGEARFAALLSPQGKILFDFIVFASAPEQYFLDCPRALADDLQKRLNLYKLRATVDLANRSDALAGVVAARRGIGVAGTHGKTTTSSMVTLIQRAAGLRPSFVRGRPPSRGGAIVWTARFRPVRWGRTKS